MYFLETIAGIILALLGIVFKAKNGQF